MAPPQLFINTKTMELEKQPEIEKENSHENSQGREDDKEDDINASDPPERTNGKDENGKAKFPLPIHSYILMFTGLAIALAGAFLGINEPTNLYFFVLGLHLFTLGCLHLAQAPGIKFFSSLLDRWDSCCNSKIARILLGTIFSVSNTIFTGLEMYILFNNYDDFDCDYYSNYYGKDGWMDCYSWPLVVLGLLISIFLALPWPLLLLCSTEKCTKPSHSRKPSGLVLRIVLDPQTPKL